VPSVEFTTDASNGIHAPGDMRWELGVKDIRCSLGNGPLTAHDEQSVERMQSFAICIKNPAMSTYPFLLQKES
jgi:hypothetical protein